MRLVYDRLVANGMTRFIVLDPMHDMDGHPPHRAHDPAGRRGRRSSARSPTRSAASTTTPSTPGWLPAWPTAADIDRVYVKDPAGLLTPERARTLIPAVRDRLGGKPLELHSHCTLGLSPLTCLTAAAEGVSVLHVACGPLSNGTSLPDAQRLAANLRELGPPGERRRPRPGPGRGYLGRLAAAESCPAGAPREYDAAFLRHQVAGGVLTTMQRQLAELGLADRFDAVLAEVPRVRAELGYPIMVTPFPQIVCSQAVYNVIGAGRYATVPDQVIRYVLGTFGRPTGPVDPDVRDRIMALPRAKELMAEPPPPGVRRAAPRCRAGRRRGTAAARGHARCRGGRHARRRPGPPPLQPRSGGRAQAAGRAGLPPAAGPVRGQTSRASGLELRGPGARRAAGARGQ